MRQWRKRRPVPPAGERGTPVPSSAPVSGSAKAAPSSDLGLQAGTILLDPPSPEPPIKTAAELEAERVAEEWRWERERLRDVNEWRRAMGLEPLSGDEPNGRTIVPRLIDV